MKDSDFFELVVQSLPIVLGLGYLFYPYEFITISYTVLGKLIAVGIIVLYSFEHLVFGFLTSLIMIWYYQLDLQNYFTEGFDKSVYLPKKSTKCGSSDFNPSLETEHISLSEAYPESLEPVTKETEAIFRKKNCVKSKLQYKEKDVSNEYAPHIYPELTYEGNVCNPCDQTCKIQVKKIDIDAILEPIQTRGTFTDSLKSIIPNSGIPFIGTKNEIATFL